MSAETEFVETEMPAADTAPVPAVRSFVILPKAFAIGAVLLGAATLYALDRKIGHAMGDYVCAQPQHIPGQTFSMINQLAWSFPGLKFDAAKAAWRDFGTAKLQVGNDGRSVAVSTRDMPLYLSAWFDGRQYQLSCAP